jgi:hypothetical protein
LLREGERKRAQTHIFIEIYILILNIFCQPLSI